MRQDLLDLMKSGVEAAVPEIIRIQQSGDMGTVEKDDKSKVTLGDSTAQAIYVSAYNAALGEKTIYYLNEEEMGEAGVSNEARKDTAAYRVAFDPIDGTGNYAKGMSRSIDELRSEELDKPIINPGFVTQGTIQDRGEDGEWKTIAAFTYEPRATDTAEKMTGRLLMSVEGMEGVQVVDYANGKTSMLANVGDAVKYPQKVVKGGFLKDQLSPEAEQAVVNAVTEGGRTLIDFKCVGQSMLAVTTGMCAGFVQENPNFYDNSSGGYLAEKTGAAVIIVDDASLGKDGKQRFPIFMSVQPELAVQMLDAYVAAKGFDPEKLIVRDGNWRPMSVSEMKAKLGVAVPGESVRTDRDPDSKRGLV